MRYEIEEEEKKNYLGGEDINSMKDGRLVSQDGFNMQIWETTMLKRKRVCEAIRVAIGKKTGNPYIFS